jgi:hypothetical protein
MQAIESRVRALKALGQSADDVAATVQREMVASHPDFPRVNGIAFAARSAYAEAP